MDCGAGSPAAHVAKGRVGALSPSSPWERGMYLWPRPTAERRHRANAQLSPAPAPSSLAHGHLQPGPCPLVPGSLHVHGAQALGPILPVQPPWPFQAHTLCRAITLPCHPQQVDKAQLGTGLFACVRLSCSLPRHWPRIPLLCPTPPWAGPLMYRAQISSTTLPRRAVPLHSQPGFSWPS